MTDCECSRVFIAVAAQLYRPEARRLCSLMNKGELNLCLCVAPGMAGLSVRECGSGSGADDGVFLDQSDTGSESCVQLA